MHETMNLVLTYARMVWRYRWVSLVVAGLVCAGGWLYVMSLPNQYNVSAKVFMDTQSLLKPLLQGLAVSSSVRENTARLVSRTLLVRPNLEKIARKTDMDLRATTPKEFELLLVELRKNIRISGTRKSNIFQISYRDSDPKLATRVVEALLNLFVEKSLGESRKDSTTTRQFLDEQIKEYEGRLIAAENRLKEFKRKNFGMMPQDGRTYFRRLETATNRRASAQLELEEAIRGRDELGRQLGELRQALAALPDANSALLEQAIAHPLDGRIGAMEQALDKLLLRFTARHPDVIAGRDQLKELSAERKADIDKLLEERKNAGPDEAGADGLNNPVYQELKIQYGAAQAQTAALEARLSEMTRREEQLKKLIDTIPKIEAELVRLNRDYKIDKGNYEKLVGRREQLRISDDANETTDDVRFNVIDPPREPLVPAGPNRPVMSAGVLVVGLGGGIALALLIALVRPSVYTRDGLAELTNLPVLGMVGRIWTPKERFRRRLEFVSFGAGCMVLLGLFVGIVVLQHLHVDLSSKLIEFGSQFL